MIDPRVVHVVVGPEEHGVVRHGAAVARACGHELIRCRDPEPFPLDPGTVDVVHLPYTDRLYASHAEASAAAFEALVAPWRAAGIAVSVTLHDLPAGDDDRDRRRRSAYDRVVRAARGVVVNSDRELLLSERLAVTARSRRRIPLPVEPVPAPVGRPETDRRVAVLGFVFPDRGYESVIDALPTGVGLTALGRPSAGHEDLPDRLATRAAARGTTMITTGFVPDEELSGRLWAAGVPVAPNRRVAASASIGTWVAHGRRPLVPDSAYSRELAEHWPGTITIYDADELGSLPRLIEQALSEPERTWREPGVAIGPSLAETAVAYRRHFAGCAPETMITVGDRQLVPGNRWDLITLSAAPPTVSAIIPWFQAQPELNLVLAGLSAQTHPRDRLQVIIADDGSTRPPDTAAADGLPVTVVRQPRNGFRAAAARNLGAAAADGQVLAFLDADTVPDPDYLTRLAALSAACPDVLAVGRRRHADFDDWTPDRLRAWYAGGAGPAELPSPGWLSDAYAQTGNLLRADHRSYRHVISAVLALHRELFDEVGGFDESFRTYGGEDWELAHRARVAGAVFTHVPEAVAWHHGPDWAGRADREPGTLNAQTLALTALLPDSEARGGGSWTRPAIVVRLGFAEPVAALATARAAYAGDADVGIWIDHPDAVTTVERLADPRISAGPPPAEVQASAQATLWLHAPARVTGLPALLATAERDGPLVLPTGRLVPHRVDRRVERWAGRLGVEADLLAARLFGGRDLPAPRGSAPIDLAHELKYVHAFSAGAQSC